MVVPVVAAMVQIMRQAELDRQQQEETERLRKAMKPRKIGDWYGDK